MSSAGRGRGYTGRHHLRETRPGDAELTEDETVARTLAELSPRATDPSKLDLNKSDPSPGPSEEEPEPKEEKPADAKPDTKYKVSGDDEAALCELLTVDEQFTPLLLLLEQFSPGEDGIQFNRKLRQFETTVTNMCPDEARLQQAFATFRACALQSSVTSRKLAAVGASFTRQQRQQLLRGTLLNVVMQGTFTKLDLLERSNPLFLINAANLMGDYFAEARLCNGNKVHILASPLLQYMRALLASDDIRAHRSLATQLMQNGRELLSVLSQELDDLSISIRLRLLSPPPVSIIWLLLSADLCLNKFLPLPNTLQQFYAAHLDLTADESYSEVSYGSWKQQDKDENSEEKVSQNLSQISLNQDDDAKPKLRPILGAGAGLLRQEQAQQDLDTWTLDTWTPKPKTTTTPLAKRYDLNSWRQQEEEKKEEPPAEPVFNPSVLPPNLQTYPVTVPDYPPPKITTRYNYPEEYPNYLQQGDGTYIQNQFVSNSNYTPQGDFVQFTPDRPTAPERVNNEVQKSSRTTARPVENWRREKTDIKEDANRNKTKNWTRQRSKDNINEEEDLRRLSQTRLNRRNSGEIEGVKTPQRRHVTEVPRNTKYWDHDDRCDKDYNS